VCERIEGGKEILSDLASRTPKNYGDPHKSTRRRNAS